MSEDAPERDDRVLAGEYALGLLTAEAAEAFEARLAVEPELRALHALWVEDLARFSADVAPVAPPAHVLTAVEARLFGATPQSSFWQRLGFGWLAGGTVAAAIAAAVLVSTGALDRGPQWPDSPALVAQIAAEDESLVVAAAYDAESGKLYVQRAEGGAIPGRALELWLIEGDNPPVSLGVLPEDPRAVLPVDAALQARLAGGVLAISDEPEGGSPTGLPTGVVLAVGPVTDA